MIKELQEKVLAGEALEREKAVALSKVADKEALYQAAGEIRDRKCGRHFDTCSIVNARS